MLEIRDISKTYAMQGQDIPVLSKINFSLQAGDSASIVGPSGSGKSSLLYIMGALEPPTTGTVLLSRQNPYQLDEKKLAVFRNEKIGFVFQDHYLLPQCTVLENVLIPTLVSRARDRQKRALELLDQVGLRHRIEHHPYELSGGEKQRVALARALVLNPLLLLCDEPTGNLDHDSTEKITELLLRLHREQQNLLIVVTHNLDVAARFPIQYRLRDGRLESGI
jgi:lipoprotein-releasing system ATP-binding protein